MKYYLAGFYLIIANPLEYDSFNRPEILTASSCFNCHLLDDFSRAWTSNEEDVQKAIDAFEIAAATISRIQDWTSQKDAAGMLGYENVFNTLESATNYQQKFFSHLDKVKLLGLYLPDSQADKLIKECNVETFKEANEAFKDANLEEGGILQLLEKKELETNEGRAIGYDLIGVEVGGSFHTFHCHSLAKYLEKEFKIQVNEYGLIETDSKWQELVAYMNDKNSPAEPVPWYFAKVKLFES
ncbi:hypothetical protein AHMF7605_21545 [Adhaeribacter arboris]|uniref:Uncharacterized protein n=1 Tax=Adhaeribacter arboris TaxID=2072846 RepID=A0A2T2YK66_9BACT|nr:hypothetical protein [Adhaeribacter arboris]PSR55901.1 hypothetical protein AHMF7605_21545 [Adhaeribacter arboris]